MKSKSLNQAGNFIMLSGEIDKNYQVLPGAKITFAEGSTFEGTILNGGITFCNNTSVVKKFVLNTTGQIQLALVSPELVNEERPEKLSALIIPVSSQSSALGDDSASELGLPKEIFTYPRPLAPSAEKELWSSSPPDSPVSVTLTPPIPTFHGELSPGNLLSSRPPSIHDESNEAILSGENAEAPSCCCMVL